MTRVERRFEPHFSDAPDEQWKRERVAAVAQRLPAELPEPTDLDTPAEQPQVQVEQGIAEITPKAAEHRRQENLPRLITETMTRQMDVLIAEVEKVMRADQERHDESQRVLRAYIEQVRAEGLAAVAVAEKQVTETQARIAEYRAKTNGAAS